MIFTEPTLIRALRHVGDNAISFTLKRQCGLWIIDINYAIG